MEVLVSFAVKVVERRAQAFWILKTFWKAWSVYASAEGNLGLLLEW
jgi:hypothetical protein